MLGPLPDGPALQVVGGPVAAGVAGPGRLPAPAARRCARGVWLEKVPFFVLGGLFAAVAYQARSSLEVVTQTRSLSSRLAQVCYSIAYYPIKTVAPAGLMPFHPIRSGANLGEPVFQLCAASVVGLSITLFLLRRRWPGMLAAWVSYLLLLAPNSGIVRMGSMLVADRYSYLATMGGFVLAAAGVAELRTWGSSRRLNLGIARRGSGLAPVPVAPDLASMQDLEQFGGDLDLLRGVLRRGGAGGPNLGGSPPQPGRRAVLLPAAR